MKWFKVHAEIIHDPKIRALAFEDRWHFVAVMALTADGTLDEPAELRDELVSVALGLHGIDLEKAKARLMRLRLIGADWKPTRWEKRQESADATAAERQRRWKESRAKSKAYEVETVSNALGNALCNGTSNGQKKKKKREEEEELRETSCDVSRDPKAKRFEPPTANEIRDWCHETGHHIDAERFIDHYTANGWRVGKVPMKSWRAAASGWWRRDQDNPKPRATGTRARSLAEDLTDRSWAAA